MMNFELTEFQAALQKTVRKFTEREIDPLATQIDRDGLLPDGLIGKMAEIGLLGHVVPKQYGGGGGEHINAALACEQIAYSGTGAWWLAAFHNSIPDSINRFGSEAIRQKYLKPLCDGSAYASIQFTEEDTGSDPRALMTTAVPDGDFYIVNGTKRFSTFGGRNGYAVMYAKDEKGKCNAFVIEKNVPGYTTTKKWELMGGGGMETVDVRFENVRVPRENLLGEEGKGFDVLLYWIAAEKIEQCAASVGMAQAALDEAVKYAKSRIVREKPISTMQGIQWMLADMHARISAARSMTYRAAFLQDRKTADWMTEAATAKLFVMPAMVDVIETARRVHGAYGYAKEFKIERIYRAVAGSTQIATGLEINRSIVGGWLVR